MKKIIFFLFFLSTSSLANELKVADFFLPEQVKSISLSPNGKQALIKLLHKNNYLLMLLEIDTAKKTIVYYSPTEPEEGSNVDDNIIRAFWLNDNDIVVTGITAEDDIVKSIINLSKDKNGELKNSMSLINTRGRILYPSKTNNNEVFVRYTSQKGGFELYTLNVKTKEYSDMLNRDQQKATNWLLDSEDNLRVVWYVEDGTQHIWHRYDNDDSWERIAKTKLNDFRLTPVAIAENNKSLIMYNNKGRDFTVLQEYHIEEEKLGDVIFEQKNSEITYVQQAKGKEGIAAVEYRDEGLNHRYYFDEGTEKLFKRIDLLIEGQQAKSVSQSTDGSRHIILTNTHENSGNYYYWNQSKSQLMLLGSKDPKLSINTDNSSIQVLNVLGKDNFNIEAYLTLPKNIANPPLIVMPHGGPIGVSDTLYFDRHSQLIVSRGYATLKVNYRGSSGFGKKFMFAGKRQWGLSIEDDINRVVDEVNKRKLTDPDKICIFGSSYGGYSAIMSVIKYPKKYKCAISFAGVTDIPLMFAEDTRVKSENYKNSMIDLVGDPIKDADYQRNNSPVYRFNEIQTPLLLAHGTKDSVVSSEHSDRLSFTLELAGIEHQYISLEGAGHGIYSTEHAEKFYNAFFDFLNQYAPVK